MQAADFWNKLALHRNKIVFLALLLFALPLASNGQGYSKWARAHNPAYDLRKISYGFSIGLHSSAYQVKYTDQFVDSKFDTLHSVMAPWSQGLSLGFLVNWRLYEYLDLRIMPKGSFYDHKLEYNYTDRTQVEQLIETVLVEFPILLKYKSMRRGNVRMYMVGGVTPGFDFSGKDDASASAVIDIKHTNLTVDAGLGFDFYFPLFKYSQEIRFSRGLPNLLGPDPSVYKEPLQKLNTNTISVYFIFQ
jgi:hypothetical protein